MKTTIEIAEPLLAQAKAAAAREGTTLRSLVEQGLRRVLGEKKPPRRFRLRKASYRGRGLQPPLREGAWDVVREMAYRGRGG